MFYGTRSFFYFLLSCCCFVLFLSFIFPPALRGRRDGAVLMGLEW